MLSAGDFLYFYGISVYFFIKSALQIEKIGMHDIFTGFDLPETGPTPNGRHASEKGNEHEPGPLCHRVRGGDEFPQFVQSGIVLHLRGLAGL